MVTHRAIAVLWVVLTVPWAGGAMGQTRPATMPSTAPGRDYAKLSGEQLVRLLLDRRTLPAAFKQLRGPGDGRFKDFHDVPSEVVVCPQGRGAKPIYIVLSHSVMFYQDAQAGYSVDKPEELFGPKLLDIQVPKPGARLEPREEIGRASCRERV